MYQLNNETLNVLMQTTMSIDQISLFFPAIVTKMENEPYILKLKKCNPFLLDNLCIGSFCISLLQIFVT